MIGLAVVGAIKNFSPNLSRFPVILSRAGYPFHIKKILGF